MNGRTSSAKKGGGLIKKNYPYRFDHLFEEEKKNRALGNI